jgi:hypothetical protein
MNTRLAEITARYAAAERRLYNAVMGIQEAHVEPRGPITLEQQRDDINYVLAELARRDAEIIRLCAALRQTGQMKSIIGARRIVADVLAACSENECRDQHCAAALAGIQF